MNNLEYIIKKFKNNENVYLHYDFEDVVMKLVPIGDDYKCISKFIGEQEREIKRGSDLAVETEMRGKIITKEQYENTKLDLSKFNNYKLELKVFLVFGNIYLIRVHI